MTKGQLGLVFQASCGYDYSMSFQLGVRSCLKNLQGKDFYRYGFAAVIAGIESLRATASKDLSHKMQFSRHCLYDILPPKTHHILPRRESNLFRFSFS